MDGLPIVLMVIGWAQIVKGFLYFTFPALALLRLLVLSYERAHIFIAPGVVFLIVAAVLGFHLWTTI